VCRFGVAPVLSDARRRIGRIAREELPPPVRMVQNDVIIDNMLSS
jgi:hypothetical protein